MLEKTEPDVETGPGRTSDSTSCDNLIDSARHATEQEKEMTLWQGVRLYPKAVAWSMLISSCIIMEGYDICLVNNFYGFDAFNRKYGEMHIDSNGNEIWQVPARWQAGLSNGAACGEIIGLFINGYVSERLGYRKTVLSCLILIAAFITIFFTAPNVQTLLVGEILAGLPWGVFQTLSVTYASEVCPVVLRGYLTTWVNCCWGIGQMIGVGVLRGFLFRKDEWSYRIPYGLQWMWPLPLFIGVLFAPESPWWLIRKGRIEDAKKALTRLTTRNSGTNFNVDETIAMMVHTNSLENEITKGATYLDCFRGTDRRRTEIVCMVWMIQNLSGNTFSNYSTYFLEQAGLSQADSYSFAIGQYAINVVGVFGAWTLMTLGLGRRALYIYGLIGLCCMLLVMGFLGLVPEEHRKQGAIATGSMMMGWALFYQCSVGTVTYSLVSELSTRQLQIKTVVLARNAYMVNPTAWNWRNYTGFFWAGTCFVSVIYSFFRLPEPAGRSFAELDLLFEQGVPARKFKTTRVDVFDPSPPSVSEGDVENRHPNAIKKEAVDREKNNQAV
ncbi:hypothetical protein KEM56_006598 [Ascosphaera pollenicola]|nr:hypothetical protein KEM56_006598 [Ascosphaera pollenicola]